MRRISSKEWKRLTMIPHDMYNPCFQEEHNPGKAYWVRPVNFSDKIVEELDDEISIFGDYFEDILLPLCKRFKNDFEFYLEHNVYTREEAESLCQEIKKAAVFQEEIAKRIRKMLQDFPDADGISIMGP